MSNLNEMINAAREGNPAKFKEIFEEEIGSRIGDALQEAKADMVAEMFGVSGEEITEEAVNVFLDSLSEEDAEYVNSLSEDEFYEFLDLNESAIRLLYEDEIDDHRKAINKAAKKGIWKSKRAIGGAIAGGAAAYKATGGNLAATAAGAGAGAVFGASSKMQSNIKKINQRAAAKAHMNTMGGSGKV